MDQNNGHRHKLEESLDQDAVKSLTNIYYDCLENIFDYLNLEDLLNVAQTCKRLGIAAAAKFGDLCDKQCVHMAVQENGPFDERLELAGNGVQVFGLRFCLPFLRCFGAKIMDLAVHYGQIEKDAEMNRYISQYCAKTLTSTMFMGQC